MSGVLLVRCWWGSSCPCQHMDGTLQFTPVLCQSFVPEPSVRGRGFRPRVVLNYRNQWLAPPGTFVTSSASYDQFVEGISGGSRSAGHERPGGQRHLNTTTVSGMYAYQQAINRKLSVSAGFQATYFQKSLDWVS